MDRDSELVRRVLLGVVVALLTARMLAPGEDPGMLSPTSGPTNLLLPLLCFLAAVGLAGWRLASRRGEWRGGVVEAALLLAALLTFVAAEMAGYKHPARIIAWDGLTLFLVVCLVRQLAVAPGDRQALFGVLLAGAASLSAQAVYQAVVRQPASATFARPAPFAAWLALFLPGLFGAAAVCLRRRAGRLQTTLTGLFAFAGAVALVVAVLSAFTQPDSTPPLADLWAATARLIAAHPLGVGPGNFSRAFPLFQPPGGAAVVADPHNFILEIAATCGVFTLLAVLAALGAFFLKAGRWLRKRAEADAAAPEPEPNERTRWEYYAGGMCGLVLGFVIRQTAADRSGDEILIEGLLACARCLVWLTAFILFERVPWSGRGLVAALTLGAAALLLALFVSPGVGLPSVAVPLWAVVGLALNELPARDYPHVNRLALTRILPFFATVLIALLYFLDAFLPVTSCSDQVQQAVRAHRQAVAGRDGAALAQKVLPLLHQAAKEDAADARVPVLLARWTDELWLVYPPGDSHVKLANSAVGYARKAQDLDPAGPDGYDADYRIRMNFVRRLNLVYRTRGNGLPALAAAVGPGYGAFFDETRWPHPLGPGAIQTLKQKKDPDEPAYQAQEAADALAKYLPHDPNDAVLRFQLAEALYKAWDDDHCREQAAEALRIDAAAARPPLIDEQRRKLNVWKDLPATK